MTIQQAPQIIQQATPYINHYGYLAVFILLSLEGLGLPLPGESTLIAAAFLAAIGKLNIFIVAIVAIISAVAGDSIGFAIGTFGGRPLVEKYGRYIFLTKKRLDKYEKFFNKHGGKVVVVSRFIEGLRQLNGIIAGISEMKWKNFIRYNALGATIWVAIWCAVGFYSGSHLQTFLKYQLYVSVAGVSAIVLAIVFLIIRHYRESAGLKSQPKQAK